MVSKSAWQVDGFEFLSLANSLLVYYPTMHIIVFPTSRKQSCVCNRILHTTPPRIPHRPHAARVAAHRANSNTRRASVHHWQCCVHTHLAGAEALPPPGPAQAGVSLLVHTTP